MWNKVEKALDLLMDRGYRVDRTDLVIKNSTKKQLVSLLTIARTHLKKGEETYGNLNRKLKNPTHSFLKELHFALGLDELGLEVKVWFLPIELLLKEIRSALDGGVISFAAKMPQDPDLLKILPSKEMGLKINDASQRLHSFFEMPSASIPVGNDLRISVTMPFAGYVRIVAYEDGDFFGLNKNMGLNHSHLQQGEYHELSTLEITPRIPRTIILGFACKFDVFDDWPKSNAPACYRNTSAMMDLLRQYDTVSPNMKSQKISSFITVSE